MGLFGKMFEKKNCDICGGEIGLLGNKKLEDGTLCKECASKLSPWFSDRRRSTVDQIREQLDWREANQQRVAQFNPTRTLGNDMKVILDEDAGRFIVTRSSRWRVVAADLAVCSSSRAASASVVTAWCARLASAMGACACSTACSAAASECSRSAVTRGMSSSALRRASAVSEICIESSLVRTV